MMLMRGATGVRLGIASFLEQKMPEQLAIARQQWGLDTYSLPDPMDYDSYDPLTLSVYPSIGSIVRRTSGWTRVDQTEFGEEVYNPTYSALIFLWVRTPQDGEGVWAEKAYDAALRLRDDELAVLRSCLLATPSLGSNGAMRVKENTLNEDYLDGLRTSSQAPQWLAGGTITVDIVTTETASLTELGTADTIFTEATDIPKAD